MDITSYYISLLEQYRSVKLAEREFQRQIDEDSSLHSIFTEWCEEHELDPKSALHDFGSDYMDRREEKWQSLNNYDD